MDLYFGLQQESLSFYWLSECLGRQLWGFQHSETDFAGLLLPWLAGLLLGLFFLKFKMNLWKWMYCCQENKGFFSLSTETFSEVSLTSVARHNIPSSQQAECFLGSQPCAVLPEETAAASWKLWCLPVDCTTHRVPCRLLVLRVLF